MGSHKIPKHIHPQVRSTRILDQTTDRYGTYSLSYMCSLTTGYHMGIKIASVYIY